MPKNGSPARDRAETTSQWQQALRASKGIQVRSVHIFRSDN